VISDVPILFCNSPTHFCSATNTSSTIDLTLRSTTLAPSLSWKTHLHLCDSDHYLSSLMTPRPSSPNPTTPKWIHSKADWPYFTLFRSDTASIPCTNSIDHDITQFTQFIIKLPPLLHTVPYKILEKILNNRLSWFLETNECLAETQYGCRKKRSTLMALAKLDVQIYETHSHNSHLFSIFFDMENAFPRDCHFLICKSLHQKGLRDLLPQLIQNYLKKRFFNVRVSNVLSTSQPQHNGIPQGLPLCGTLFLVAIDDIIKKIPSPIHSLIFVDDLSIHLRSSNPQRAYRILQEQFFQSFSGSPIMASEYHLKKPNSSFLLNPTLKSHLPSQHPQSCLLPVTVNKPKPQLPHSP